MVLVIFTERGCVTSGNRRRTQRRGEPSRSPPSGQWQGYLPEPPTDKEKYSYAKRRPLILTVSSLISFVCLLISQFKFISLSPWLFGPMSVFLAFTVIYYLIAFAVNFGAKSFDVEEHKRFVRDYWNKARGYRGAVPTIDVMLPIYGEPVEVLHNTWIHAREMVEHYRHVNASYGRVPQVRVFVLDDGSKLSSSVAKLAQRPEFVEAGFRYHPRPHPPVPHPARPDQTLFGTFRRSDWAGENKKAGNLMWGFDVTAKQPGEEPGEYVLILDADFAPRPDFLLETVPYMASNPGLGIVQTPQFFRDVKGRQNWLERGAGDVQELFYRFIQQARNALGGAICVGTNALYRRAALKENGGGPTQIGHSEDVHTGFDFRYLCKSAWRLFYLPLVLATGTCPNTHSSFGPQQYRWCFGSGSLLSAKKFWKATMPLRTRLCYLSGFCYYLHTAIFTFVGPIIPIVLLTSFPEEVRLRNFALILPSVVYNSVVFRLWHRTKYGVNALAVKLIYGWAHAFAIYDKLRGKQLGWSATGARAKAGDWRIRHMRLLIGGWGLATGLAWVGLSVHYMVTRDLLDFAPNLLTGLFYLTVVVRAISPTPDVVQPRPQV